MKIVNDNSNTNSCPLGLFLLQLIGQEVVGQGTHDNAVRVWDLVWDLLGVMRGHIRGVRVSRAGCCVMFTIYYLVD